MGNSNGNIGIMDLFNQLRQLGLNDLAVLFLNDLWEIIQELDDIQDEGTCDCRNLTERIFVSMLQNPWFQANIQILAPVLTTQVYKWFAANNLEAEKKSLEKAYMLRAGYYDVVMYVASLHGRIENPEIIVELYGETYEEYSKEIKNA